MARTFPPTLPIADPPLQLSEPTEGVPPITAARRNLGMSLNDLARAAHMDPAHLELMERRSHFASPTLAELERIAGILRVGVEQIR